MVRYDSVGCDSVATLDLTIDLTTSSNTIVTSCNSYTWNGVVYTISGIYTWLGTNSVGCDSVATLDLTIDLTTSSNTIVTVVIVIVVIVIQ